MPNNLSDEAKAACTTLPSPASSPEPVTAVTRVASLGVTTIVALVTIRAAMTGGDTAAATPFARLVALGTRSYYDVAMAAALFASLLLLAGVNGTGQRWRRLIVGAAIVASVTLTAAALMNSKALAILGGPLTYQWLYYADFFMSYTSQNAVLETIDRDFLLALIAVPFVTVAVALGLARASAIFPAIHVAMAIAAGPFVLAYLALSPVVLDMDGLPVRQRANAIVEFVRSALAGPTPLFSRPTRQDDAEFSSGGQYSTFSAERVAGIRNVLLIVLESVGDRFVNRETAGFLPTPNLLSLKKHSIRFSNIYAHSPTTSKSLFSLLTSRYPRLSYQAETIDFRTLPLDTLPGALKRQGYRTGFFTSADLRFQSADSFLENRGLDVLRDMSNMPCDRPADDGSTDVWEFLGGVDDACTAHQLVSWIDGSAGDPFFAVMWTNLTHWPYFPRNERTFIQTDDKYLLKYLSALTDTDAALGTVFDTLRTRGLLDSTLIVVLGDHGEAFLEHGERVHGQSIYEEEVHIPLLLINPTLFQGEHSNTLGGVIDVAPTIMDILQFPAGDGWQGRSLFSADRHERVYLYSAYRDLVVGYREGDFKYHLNTSTDVLQVFDLVKDPAEKAGSIVDDMVVDAIVRDRFAAWMQHQERMFAEACATGGTC